MKANNNRSRSHPYFERVRKFWEKLSFLFRMKYLKSKAKSNQEVTKASETETESDTLHPSAGDRLTNLSIPRVIKENDFMLDFFQFSIYCQNLIYNNQILSSRSNVLDIVQRNFRGNDNFKELFCFAVLINQRIHLSNTVKWFFTIDNNILRKRAQRFKKIYVACMKDVDKYLKLLSGNNVSGDTSTISKRLIPPKHGACNERWNLNEWFRRINMLASFASSNRFNKRIIMTSDKITNPLKQSQNCKFANLPVSDELIAIKRELIIDPIPTYSPGPEHIVLRDGKFFDRLGFRNNSNVYNQGDGHRRFEFQEDDSVKFIQSGKLPLNHVKSCLSPSKYNENSKIHKTNPHSCFDPATEPQSKFCAATNVFGITDKAIIENNIEENPEKLNRNQNMTRKRLSHQKELDLLQFAQESVYDVLKETKHTTSEGIPAKSLSFLNETQKYETNEISQLLKPCFSQGTEKLPEYTRSFTNPDFVCSENRGSRIRDELKCNASHMNTKTQKESENINSTFRNTNHKETTYLMQPADDRMLLVGTLPECIDSTRMPSKHSSPLITTHFSASDNNIENKIQKPKCSMSEIDIKPERKLPTSQTKDTVAEEASRARKKKKFRTSLKLDDVKRVFNIIEPRYRSFEYPNHSANDEYIFIDKPKRIRKYVDHRIMMVNQQSSLNEQEKTADDQKSNKAVQVTIMRGQNMMATVEKEKHVNYQYTTMVNGESNLDGSTPIMDEHKNDINYQNISENYHVATVGHKEIGVDEAVKNVDGQELIIDSYVTITDEKMASDQGINEDCGEMAPNYQKMVMDGNETNLIDQVSNHDMEQAINAGNRGETWGNNQETTVENQETLATDQNVMMVGQKINMVHPESYMDSQTTNINDQERIKNGQGAIMEYEEKNIIHDKSILENLGKNKDDQGVAVDYENSNMGEEKNMSDQKDITAAQETAAKFDVTRIDHRELNLYYQGRNGTYLDSNIIDQEKNSNDQSTIISGQETNVANQEMNNLISKRKRCRRNRKKIEFINEVKSQRPAKLKAILLLKRVRRVRQTPPASI